MYIQDLIFLNEQSKLNWQEGLKGLFELKWHPICFQTISPSHCPNPFNAKVKDVLVQPLQFEDTHLLQSCYCFTDVSNLL